MDARKALHWKEVSNETRDANIRLYYGKTMFAAQVSNFAITDRHCTRCKIDGITVDETFVHGCYDCPHINKHFKRGAERDFEREIFFKFINMHTYAELNRSKKYGNQPTLSNLVTTICGEILKTIQFFN